MNCAARVAWSLKAMRARQCMRLRMRNLSLWLGLAAVLGAGTARAGLPLPPTDPWNELPVATLETKPANALKLGSVTVWLEFNTLAEVMRVAGVAEIAHFEDDKAAFDWICYDNAALHQRLWFISDTDNGGAQRMVTSVAAQFVYSNSSDGCALLPKTLSKVALDRGVWLDSSEAELAQKLGEPSGVLRDWRSYYSNHRMVQPRTTPNEAGEMQDDIAESSYLNLRVEDGHVVQLIAGKMTGY